LAAPQLAQKINGIRVSEAEVPFSFPAKNPPKLCRILFLNLPPTMQKTSGPYEFTF
jgi:hypothetical protein